MTHLSKSQVFGIFKKFENKYKFNLSVSGLPNYQSLGLRDVEVLITVKHDKVQDLKKIIGTHPFLVFYADIFGDFNGLYVEFNIPVDSLEILNSLFQKLKHIGYIERFEIFGFSSKPSYSHLNVEELDFETLVWKFNWSNWLEEPVKIIQDVIAPKKSFEKTRKWLRYQDIVIMGEIQNNVRRKNQDILKNLEEKGHIFTGPTFSRRLNHLKTECVDSYLLNLNFNHFSNMSMIFLWGYEDEKTLQETKSRIKSRTLPFNSKYNTIDMKFYWLLQLPSSQISDFLFRFKSEIPELHVNFVDYSRCERFTINPLSWDKKARSWNTSKKFLINDVLDVSPSI